MGKSFKDLIVWQKSMSLVENVYKITSSFSAKEQFGLTAQMLRAAISIPSNIAEGSKRGTKKDYLQFLRIANGSAAELETQMLISKKLYSQINIKELDSLLLEIQKMLAVMIRKLS